MNRLWVNKNKLIVPTNIIDNLLNKRWTQYMWFCIEFKTGRSNELQRSGNIYLLYCPGQGKQILRALSNSHVHGKLALPLQCQITAGQEVGQRDCYSKTAKITNCLWVTAKGLWEWVCAKYVKKLWKTLINKKGVHVAQDGTALIVEIKTMSTGLT